MVLEGCCSTFFILARRKLLTRNLNLSSSVCIMINLKFVFGSMFPVWSSTNSIFLQNQLESESRMARHTCCRMRSSTRSMSSWGHGNISGALRSATQRLVSSCRSRVSCGIAPTSTSASRSSISMFRRNEGRAERRTASRKKNGKKVIPQSRDWQESTSISKEGQLV